MCTVELLGVNVISLEVILCDFKRFDSNGLERILIMIITTIKNQKNIGFRSGDFRGTSSSLWGHKDLIDKKDRMIVE